ncbi:MAG: anti sigma factor C-terminal domain-containing protein [Lysinibacillus sp.]
MPEWSNGLENKILKKPKWALTIKIIRVFVALLLIYAVYMIGLSMAIDQLDSERKHTYYSQVAIEWTVPNVRGVHHTEMLELSPFGTQTFRYNLVKMVGHEEVIVGDVTMKKALFNPFSQLKITHLGKEQLSSFSFSLPEDPRTGEKLFADSGQSDVWTRLEKLPEGTVGELAFSTTSFMSPEELIELLKDYELDILWMPLYTGEFLDDRPLSWSGGGSSISISGVIGLSGGRDHGAEFDSFTRINNSTADNIEDSKRMMLKNMEELLAMNKSYYGGLLGLNALQQQYTYIQDEGFIAYGAVVTGPVKELLKLKELETIQSVQLGEVELWNWDPSNF